MTTNILRIDASIFGGEGVSSQLTQKLVDHLAAVTGDVSVTSRHLAGSEIPHFSAATIEAIGAGKAVLADALIAEVQAADIIVLGVPMYNFGVPSELKAWFDHIARANVTFEYTDEGPVGLLKDKKVYVVTTRGGLHKDKATDVEAPFLTIMLGFLGLHDVEFIFAEGLNMGADMRENGIAAAEKTIVQLVKPNEAA